VSLKQILFEGATAGTSATTANSGASVVNKGGGTSVFSAAAASHGNCGLEFVTTATGQYNIARFLANASNVQMAFSGVFAIGASFTADTTIGAIRQATSDTFVCRFNVNSANAFRVVDSGLTNVSGGSFTLTPGTKYRIEVLLTGGSTTAGVITARLYTAAGSTALNTWTSTTANLHAGTPNGAEIGCCSSNQAATIRWDDLQFNDGASVEIGPVATDPLTGTGTLAPTTGEVPLAVAVTLTATGGTGSGRLYSVDWGDGQTSGPQAGSAFNHTYSAAGTYAPSGLITEPA